MIPPRFSAPGWSRRSFLQTSLLASAAAISTSRAESAPANIGAHKQLFLDDTLIDLEKSTGLTRTLNPPVRVQRVLTPDQPHEALGFIFYCSVVDDGGTATLFHGSYDGEKKKHFMVATSTDGLHWERPKLGLKEFAGSAENNLLPLGAVEVCAFLDPHSPPEKRYRLVFTQGWPDPEKGGVYTASSADGIHWNVAAKRSLPFLPDSQPSAFWDPRLGKYVIYLRAWVNKQRAICRVETDDLESAWSYDASVPPYQVWGKDKIPTLSRELPSVLACDEHDPEHLQLYTSVMGPYPYAPDAYLAFPAGFQLYKGPAWQDRALTTSDGPFDVLFATSRDGISWQRWRQPYLPAGFYDGLDLRLVSMGPGIVRRGAWLHQYFVGWPYTHGAPTAWDRDPAKRADWLGKDRGGIYCATQRLDGFVSMDTGNDGGTLTTRPLIFQGARLLVNFHAPGIGHARIALLDETGTPLPGFSLADSEYLQDDAIAAEARWKNSPDLTTLAGKPVRVQFELRNTKLYSFQFAPLPA